MLSPAGTAFAGSSWYYLHLALGHATFMSLMYLPLILALYWVGWRRRQTSVCGTDRSSSQRLFSLKVVFYQISYLPLDARSASLIVLQFNVEALFPIAILPPLRGYSLSFSQHRNCCQ